MTTKKCILNERLGDFQLSNGRPPQNIFTIAEEENQKKGIYLWAENVLPLPFLTVSGQTFNI
jgi:hypothetical protein